MTPGIKGWLLFFVITVYLTAIEGFLNAGLAFYNAQLSIGVLLLLSVFFSAASAVALTRKDPKALEITYVALVFHGVVGLVDAGIFHDGWDAAGTAIYTTIAVLYFLKSKRVAATFAKIV